MKQSEAVFQQIKHLLNDEYRHSTVDWRWYEVENDKVTELIQLLQLLLPCEQRERHNYKRDSNSQEQWVALNNNAMLYMRTPESLLEDSRVERAWDFDFFEIENYYGENNE